MTRSTAREIALQLGFSAVASEDFPDDVLERFFEPEHYASLAAESELFAQRPGPKQMDYIRRLVTLIYDHRIELDRLIEKYSNGWKASRISRPAMAILRCALCEVLYMDDVPDRAAINEAVELSKGYTDAETAAFINGVLGGFMRGERSADALSPETEEEKAAEEAEEDAPVSAAAEE